MPEINRVIPALHLAVLTFADNAVAASQAGVDLPRVETSATTSSTDVKFYEMPFAGTIVALSATLSAAATAGTLALVPTVNGTAVADPALAITTQTALTDTAPRGSIAFAAGDALGVEITTNGAWDGTTADLFADLYVVFDLTNTGV